MQCELKKGASFRQTQNWIYDLRPQTNKQNLLWNSIVSDYFPQLLVVNAVEDFLKVHDVYIKRGLSFSSPLFYDAEGGY